jgi:hypothetical protein
VQLKTCFELMDADGSGAIDADELQDAFQLLGLNFTRAEIKVGPCMHLCQESRDVSLHEFVLGEPKIKGRHACRFHLSCTRSCAPFGRLSPLLPVACRRSALLATRSAVLQGVPSQVNGLRRL